MFLIPNFWLRVVGITGHSIRFSQPVDLSVKPLFDVIPQPRYRLVLKLYTSVQKHFDIIPAASDRMLKDGILKQADKLPVIES